MQSLAIHLADLAAAEAISVQEALTAHPDQACLLAGQALAVVGQPPAATVDAPCRPVRLVLVVDQLEELFTLTTNHADQDAFLAALHSLATEPVLPGGEPGVLVILSVRGDFLKQALAFHAIRHAAEAGVFAVGAMSESELREAVVGPAAEAGVRVPDDLCTSILEDLRESSLPVGFDSGALPLLSQVMFVMWQAKDTIGLTLRGYHHTGGVADIVRTSAEQVYETLSLEHRELARRTFIHLTATTEGILTRRPSTRSALRTAAGSDEADKVIEAFAVQRLLTVSDSDLVTIAHEELLRSWNRLRDWLQPDLTDQALHRALADDVHDWRQRQHDPSYLYQGGRLVAVNDALQRWADDPTRHFGIDAATTDFLRASRRRSRRRQRAYQTVGAVMVLLLMVAGTSAVFANRNAATAQNNADRADHQHALALSRQLAAVSSDLSTTDRTAAEQFALAALDTADTDEARTAVSTLLNDHRNTLPSRGRIGAFSPDGALLAIGGFTGEMQLWDTRTGLQVSTELAGSSIAAFSPTGKLMATGNLDGTAQLRNPRTARPDGPPLAGHTGPVWPIFSPDGTRLATQDEDNTVQLWDTDTRQPVGAPITDSLGKKTEEPLFGGVSFSPDGKFFTTLQIEGTTRLWDARTGVLAKTLGEPPEEWSMDVGFSQDGNFLVVGGESSPQWWDLRTGRTVKPPGTGYADESFANILLSPDGRYLATGNSKAVRLRDAHTGRPTGKPLSGAGTALAFSADGRLLATEGQNNTVQLWNSRAGSTIGAPLTGPSDESIETVLFSPDGTKVAIIWDDGTVRLWDPNTGLPAGVTITAPTTWLLGLAFSHDGQLIATGHDDGTARLWDPNTGRPAGAPLAGNNGWVNQVMFSRNGKRLAVASDDPNVADDGTLQLWDPSTRQPVGKPIYRTTHEAFNPDGRLLATGGLDKAVRLRQA
jgi:WD40 repeat protein